MKRKIDEDDNEIIKNKKIKKCAIKNILYGCAIGDAKGIAFENKNFEEMKKFKKKSTFKFNFYKTN